jgi:OOP family OmpA-OmpF porin
VSKLARIGISIALLASARAARAEGDVDLRTFRPSTDKLGTLATEPVETPGPWNVQIGQWVSYATPIFKMREAGTAAQPEGDTRTIIGMQLVGDPTFALGLGRRAAIGVTMPVVLAQSGEASSLSEGRPLPRQGIGDLTFTGKVALIAADPDIGGVGVGFVTRISVPTGDRASYVGESGVTAEGRMLLGYDLGHLVFLNATAGYRARFVQHDLANLTLGDTVPWGVTLGLKPRGLGLDEKGHWTWMLEGHGEIGAVPNKLFADSHVSPVLYGASARYQLDRSWSLFSGIETSATAAIGVPRLRMVLGITFAPTVVDEDGDGVPDDVDECPGLMEDGKGARPHDGCPDYSEEIDATPHPASIDTDGDGIPDDVDKCPNEPGPPDSDGCPPPVKIIGDSDKDGILDDVDKCPDQAETVNGFEDEDGCPESDRDNDTFLDDVDSCPDEPETFNGYKDDDGCPDTPPKDWKPKTQPLVTAKPANAKDPKSVPSVSLARAIVFDGASVAKDSTGDLRALAAYVLTHPGTRLRVAVKPEGKGDDAQKLATARAAAIVSSLVLYAHTGNVAEAAPWDPKSKTPINVEVTVLPPPAKPSTP